MLYILDEVFYCLNSITLLFSGVIHSFSLNIITFFFYTTIFIYPKCILVLYSLWSFGITQLDNCWVQHKIGEDTEMPHLNQNTYLGNTDQWCITDTKYLANKNDRFLTMKEKQQLKLFSKNAKHKNTNL